MIIGACGFGSTGSSAVSDYLSEFGNVQVLDKLEFTWVSGIDGLVDLDYHVNHPHSRTSDSIYAIHRYRERMRRLLKGYSRIAGCNPNILVESTERFLETITNVKWNWYVNEQDCLLLDFFKRFAKKRILKKERKIGHQIVCWPMKEVSLSVLPDNFEEAARRHVKEILVALGATFDNPLILDQPFAGNNPQACFKFFEDPYAIIVDRDPRDNYVFANTKLVGKLPHFMPVQPVGDFVKYYRALRDKQPYKEKNDRLLSIQFEDMVYHYDETTRKIRDFLHLPDNPNPKSIFDPAISMPNTQVWKRFPQFAKDIDFIEKELPEYLFDYTGCPEPDPKGTMFSGKSPKNKKS